MLPSKERLTRSSLFQRAYTARKSISSPLFTLYVVPRTKQPGARGAKAAFNHSENAAELPVGQKSAAKMPKANVPLERTPQDRMPLMGFVVAKKVCKSACVRNRAKRRLREAYRILRLNEQSRQTLALNQWYAVVLVVHDKAISATWDEIKKTVSESLAKAHTKFGAQCSPQSGMPAQSGGVKRPVSGANQGKKPAEERSPGGNANSHEV